MESSDKIFENMDILARLKHFEKHQLLKDDPYGAEVLNRAQKKIKELEAENKELIWELDASNKELMKSAQENQRLKEALKEIIVYCKPEEGDFEETRIKEYISEIAQKALEK